MRVTFREILASVSILTFMVILGVFIGDKVSDWEMDSKEKYNKAISLESSELFRYGMDTNVGNAFVYGELEAVDIVTNPDVTGEYLFLKKTKEVYTKHTRTSTKTVDGKTKVVTETYWTWDEVGHENFQSKGVKFSGIDFNASQFKSPSLNYIRTVQAPFSDVRYKYYGYPAKSTVTIFANLVSGNIGESGADVYPNKTIKETRDSLDSDKFTILFSLGWALISLYLVYLFVYCENRWLNK